jgi:AcrR family transcriptional regulator
VLNAKRNILNIAKSRFERFGYRKTSLDDICKDAGCSKRTVYQCFENKEDLFVTLFISEALSSRNAILNKLKDVEDPLEKIKKFFKFAEEYYEKEPFMVNVLQDEHGLYAPFLRKKYRSLVEEGILDTWSMILREGIEKGKFRDIDTSIASYIIFKLFQAFTYARTLSSRANRKSEEEELETLVNLLCHGICSS